MEGCRQTVEGEEVCTRARSSFIDFKAPTGKAWVSQGPRWHGEVPGTMLCQTAMEKRNAENRRKPEQSLTLRR